jgi:hypothetical protein
MVELGRITPAQSGNDERRKLERRRARWERFRNWQQLK